MPGPRRRHGARDQHRHRSRQRGPGGPAIPEGSRDRRRSDRLVRPAGSLARTGGRPPERRRRRRDPRAGGAATGREPPRGGQRLRFVDEVRRRLSPDASFLAGIGRAPRGVGSAWLAVTGQEACPTLIESVVMRNTRWLVGFLLAVW